MAESIQSPWQRFFLFRFLPSFKNEPLSWKNQMSPIWRSIKKLNSYHSRWARRDLSKLGLISTLKKAGLKNLVPGQDEAKAYEVILEVLNFVGLLRTHRTPESRFRVVDVGVLEKLPDPLKSKSKNGTKEFYFRSQDANLMLCHKHINGINY